MLNKKKCDKKSTKNCHKMEKIRFVDLFAGIGGFHKAIELVAKEKKYNIECVFVSEIDQEAIKTYTSNFEDTNKKKIINIRNLDDNASEVPDHDFLFGGFPCQTFSNAGKKRGFLDEIRGTLFFDITKILKNKKPKYILLENVKHLVNHDSGKTWNIITTKLKELGYIIPKEPLILSPHEFGIPQERYRVFIPGILKEKTDIKDEYLKFNFDDLKHNNPLQKTELNEVKNYIWNSFLEKKPDKKYFLDENNPNDKYILKTLDAWNCFIKKVKRPPNKTLPVIWADEFWKGEYSLDGFSDWKKKYILDMRSIYKENKIFIDKWIINYDVKNWKKREQKLEWQVGKDINDIKDSFIQLRQSGIRCKRPVKFPTLVAMVQIPLIYDKNHENWRHLTPRELANLQSFPEDYKTYSELDSNNKDFYSYKQFGNAVNVNVVFQIQKKLLELG